MLRSPQRRPVLPWMSHTPTILDGESNRDDETRVSMEGGPPGSAPRSRDFDGHNAPTKSDKRMPDKDPNKPTTQTS